MKPFYIGIDPGKNGGIVGITNGKINIINKMPASAEALWQYFIDLGFPNMLEKDQTYVIIEDVHSMPTDGVKSAFSFGKHIGIFDGIFAALGIQPIRVSPGTWQKYFKIQREKGEAKYTYKKRLLQMALSLLGRYGNSSKSTEINLATADAFLIALYAFESGKLIYQGSEETK